MRVGIDIDGTITDIFDFEVREGSKFFNKEPVNNHTLSVKEMFGCTEEEEQKFWNHNFLKYCIMESPRKGTSEFIKHLHDGNHEAFIITSRKFADDDSKVGQLMRFIVKEWCKCHKIDVDEILFCSDDKTETIKNNDIDIMIEDDVNNIENFSEFVKVICMDNPYNDIEFTNTSNIKRINSMSEAYPMVQEIELELMKQKADERASKEVTVKSGKGSIDRPWMKYYPFECRNVPLPDCSVYDYLKDNTIKFSNMIALNYFGRKITYKEMFDEIDKYAQAFSNKGINEGDIVTLCLPNIPEAIYMFYGLNKIGAIANMVHPLKSANEIKKTVKETDSKLLVTVDSTASNIADIDVSTIVVSASHSMPLSLKLIYDSMNRNQNVYGNNFISVKDFLTEVNLNSHVNSPIVKGDDVCVIMHTGGTSGEPKGVQLTNNNFNRMVFQQKLTAKNFEPGDKMLTIMPVFHGFGLCSSVHMPLSYGITTILVPKFEADKFHNLIRRYKPNHIFGVPKLLNLLKNDENIDSMDLSFLRYLVAGGEKLDSSTEDDINRFLQRHNCYYKVKKGYGSTECVAGTTLSDDNCNELGSLGIPLLFNNFKIVKPTTCEEVDYNQEGEMCISGPTVMKGYFNDVEATLNALKRHPDGKIWYHTGDLGYMTEDGLIYYTGRMNRMYISGGFNIYPQRIEDVISGYNHVRQCAVVPIQHPIKDIKVPKVFVTMDDGVDLDSGMIEEMRELCQENLDLYHQPFEFTQLDEMPVTKVGKVDYQELSKIPSEGKSYVKGK